MTYSQQNLIDIEQAIVDSARGKRVVRIIIEGKSIEYSQANIDDLKNFMAEIKVELQAVGSTSPRAHKNTQGVVMHHLKVLDFRGDKIPAARYVEAVHYEGAGTGRRKSYWGLSTAGPNNTLYSS